MGPPFAVCGEGSATGLPFKLLYGQQPQGVLDVLKDEWETPSQVEEALASYQDTLQKKLQASAQLAREELAGAQLAQKRQYDPQVQPHTFEVSQKVLLLLLSSSRRLLVSCQGPYEVLEQVGEVNYCIHIPGQGRCLYHVNGKRERIPDTTMLRLIEMRKTETGPTNCRPRWRLDYRPWSGTYTRLNRY